MRHYLDTGILLGKVLMDDDFHDTSTAIFAEFHYGEPRVLYQVIFDMESMVLQEANAITLSFQKICPIGQLGKMDKDDAKSKVRSVLGQIKRQARMKHAGVKDEVREALYKAIDEGNIVDAVKSIPVSLPKRLHDLIVGCLGQEVLGEMAGLASGETEERIKSALEQELAGHVGSFGHRDDNDRRILSGLVLECHRKPPVTFYTFDKAFFDGYRKLWSKQLDAAFEPARELTFVYIDPNAPASRQTYKP